MGLLFRTDREYYKVEWRYTPTCQRQHFTLSAEYAGSTTSVYGTEGGWELNHILLYFVVSAASSRRLPNMFVWRNIQLAGSFHICGAHSVRWLTRYGTARQTTINNTPRARAATALPVLPIQRRRQATEPLPREPSAPDEMPCLLARNTPMPTPLFRAVRPRTAVDHKNKASLGAVSQPRCHTQD